MPSPSEAALHKLEAMLSRDPILREVIGKSLPRADRGGAFQPDIDVIELPDRYVILIDVPGVPRDGLDVRIEGQTLAVTGQKLTRHPEGGVRKIGERTHGKFSREFQLPCVVDGAAVTAKIVDGVLRIEVPRNPAGHTVHVPVS
jgi:HSP20 family protein